MDNSKNRPYWKAFLFVGVCYAILIASLFPFATSVSANSGETTANGYSAIFATSCFFPIDVASESELNSAIDCYNGSAAGDYQINVTSNFFLVTNTHTINNNSGATLLINGNGNQIDGGGNGRIFNIESSDVTLNHLTLFNGFANNGGGVNVAPSAIVTLTASTVMSSTAVNGGDRKSVV